MNTFLTFVLQYILCSTLIQVLLEFDSSRFLQVTFTSTQVVLKRLIFYDFSSTK